MRKMYVYRRDFLTAKFFQVADNALGASNVLSSESIESQVQMVFIMTPDEFNAEIEKTKKYGFETGWEAYANRVASLKKDENGAP